MANTYTSLNYHLVFSTKNREPWLTESVCERLWPYLGGIARENGMKALEICGWQTTFTFSFRFPPAWLCPKRFNSSKGVRRIG